MQKAHLNKHLCLVPCKIKGKTLGRSTKMPRLHEKKKIIEFRFLHFYWSHFI